MTKKRMSVRGQENPGCQANPPLRSAQVRMTKKGVARTGSRKSRVARDSSPALRSGRNDKEGVARTASGKSRATRDSSPALRSGRNDKEGVARTGSGKSAARRALYILSGPPVRDNG